MTNFELERFLDKQAEAFRKELSKSISLQPSIPFEDLRAGVIAWLDKFETVCANSNASSWWVSLRMYHDN